MYVLSEAMDDICVDMYVCTYSSDACSSREILQRRRPKRNTGVAQVLQCFFFGRSVLFALLPLLPPLFPSRAREQAFSTSRRALTYQAALSSTLTGRGRLAGPGINHKEGFVSFPALLRLSRGVLVTHLCELIVTSIL